MTGLVITQEKIIDMTRTLGEGWAYPHVRRVLALGQTIAGELNYDPKIFWYAAYLHDWGAFSKYRQEGVDHALRSKQVAEGEVLPFTGLGQKAISIILDAIEHHDYRDEAPVQSAEALLLREADFLDFLGLVGLAREFAWGPNDLRKVVNRAQARIKGIRGRFQLPAAQALAEERIAEMEHLLRRMEEDSQGFL